MGNKPVSMLPGIGLVYAREMEVQGFTHASMVFGKFLVLGQSQQRFIYWLQSVVPCNYHHALACWWALEEWRINFF